MIRSLVLFLLFSKSAHAEIDRNAFVSREWGVLELVAPRDWRLAEMRSYPGILVSAIHRGGPGRMSLAAERVAANTTAETYAKESGSALLRVGYQVTRMITQPSQAVIMEATTEDKTARLRQGIVVADGVAYVLTLAAPATAMPGYVSTFDFTLGHLKIAAPPPTSQP